MRFSMFSSGIREARLCFDDVEGKNKNQPPAAEVPKDATEQPRKPNEVAKKGASEAREKMGEGLKKAEGALAQLKEKMKSFVAPSEEKSVRGERLIGHLHDALKVDNLKDAETMKGLTAKLKKMIAVATEKQLPIEDMLNMLVTDDWKVDSELLDTLSTPLDENARRQVEAIFGTLDEAERRLLESVLHRAHDALREDVAVGGGGEVLRKTKLPQDRMDEIVGLVRRKNDPRATQLEREMCDADLMSKGIDLATTNSSDANIDTIRVMPFGPGRFAAILMGHIDLWMLRLKGFEGSLSGQKGAVFIKRIDNGDIRGMSDKDAKENLKMREKRLEQLSKEERGIGEEQKKIDAMKDPTEQSSAQEKLTRSRGLIKTERAALLREKAGLLQRLRAIELTKANEPKPAEVAKAEPKPAEKKEEATPRAEAPKKPEEKPAEKPEETKK